MAIPTEKQEQNRLAKWLDLAVGEYGWLHIPNEGRRRHGAQAVRAGLKKGAPDVLVFARLPAGSANSLASLFRGVAIELKRADGGEGLSEEQARWFRELQLNGWHVILAYGADQAVDKLQALGFGIGIPLQTAAERRG